MANVSILTALERMWQHIVIALSVKSDISHNHEGVYCTESDVSSGFNAINSSINNIIGGSTKVASAENADLANIANIATRAEQDSGGHIISDTYETKSDAASKYEQANAYTDSIASGKSDSNHNHDLDYDTKGAADEKSAAALASAKGYVDSKVSTLASFTDVNNSISEHDTSTSAHNDIRGAFAELNNRIDAIADSDDITLDQLSEIVAYIKSNKSLIDSITTNKVNVSDIIDDLATNVSKKPLSAAQGFVVKQLIDDLAGAMTLHSNNTAIHITSTERTNWNDANTQKHLHSNKSVLDAITATADEINILDGITVSTTELNYIDGLTDNVQAQIDFLSTEIASISSSVTVSSTDGVNYTANVSHIKATTIDGLKGVKLVIIPNMTSTSASNVTLNINNLGAKSIKRWDNLVTSEWWSFLASNWLVAGYPITVTFNGTYWIIEGMNKPYATDLQGTVPIEKGGTGVTSHTDTTYTTARYRASALVNVETNPSTNGVINWTYE